MAPFKYELLSRTLYYSRSNMEEHMVQMLQVGMLKQEDLTVFSEELQKSLERWLR